MKNIKNVQKIKRNFYGVEIDHKYFIIDQTTTIKKRITEKVYHDLLFDNFAPD